MRNIKKRLNFNGSSEENDRRDNNKVEKSNGRILRSRQFKRNLEENRPKKRLFTPEIKRYLKNWLIRRRENPYPNRQEKIELAVQTGLTYIQISNWFANWRRKLKNSGKNISKFTWSTLIKSYNNQALGNVEHLSISSDDSIWEEPNRNQCSIYDADTISETNYSMDNYYTSVQNTVERIHAFKKANGENFFTELQFIDQSESIDLPQCFQISSTTDFVIKPHKVVEDMKKITLFNKSLKINEKIYNHYFRNKRRKPNRDKNWNYKMDEKRIDSKNVVHSRMSQIQGDSLLLSKWRKSAALFQPSFKNYVQNECLEIKTKNLRMKYENFHGKEEIDAAEALTFLSHVSTNKFE